MTKLPKSLVIEGRRYPTWALSVKARDQLNNLNQVDAHIAELNDRLALYRVARGHYQQLLMGALVNIAQKPKPFEATRYFWHSVSKKWAQSAWPIASASLTLGDFESTSHYRQGDRIIWYVKGHGAVGWGVVEMDTHSTKRHLVWQDRVAELDKALAAKMLKEFALRHPNRPSQMLPANADVAGLLAIFKAKSTL